MLDEAAIQVAFASLTRLAYEHAFPLQVPTWRSACLASGRTTRTARRRACRSRVWTSTKPRRGSPSALRSEDMRMSHSKVRRLHPQRRREGDQMSRGGAERVQVVTSLNTAGTLLRIATGIHGRGVSIGHQPPDQRTCRTGAPPRTRHCRARGERLVAKGTATIEDKVSAAHAMARDGSKISPPCDGPHAGLDHRQSVTRVREGGSWEQNTPRYRDC